MPMTLIMKYGGTKGSRIWAAILEEGYPHSNMMVQEELKDGTWSEPRTFQKRDVPHMNSPHFIHQVWILRIVSISQRHSPSTCTMGKGSFETRHDIRWQMG